MDVELLQVGQRGAGQERPGTVVTEVAQGQVEDFVFVNHTLAKPDTDRRAVARGLLRVSAETLALVRDGKTKKGDVIAAARIAGIMAAKRTSELIPLCHPLPLTHVGVTLSVGEDAVEILASAETTAQTGVEMEALTAAAVAALTVYDMAKAIDKDMVVAEVRLVEKTKEPA